MGNRQAHHKEEHKLRGDDKSDKEAHKERKKEEKNDNKDKRYDKVEEKNDKKDKRKRFLEHTSDMDTDGEESSHVTGGDSESCVFHSVENVSSPSDMNASNRNEHEQGTLWKETLNSPSKVIKHSHVLSSSDFHDGFSLEACIPPEMAWPGTWSQAHVSPRSVSVGTVSQSQAQGKASCQGSLSPLIGKYGHKTLTTSALFDGGTDKPHELESISSSCHSVQDTGGAEYPKMVSPASGNSSHHPHFYNHHQGRQHQHTNLPVVTKPSSIQPQRRTLSTKMMSPPCKLTSSGDVPPVSTVSPASCRAVNNLLVFFRSSSKREKNVKNFGANTTEPTSLEVFSKSDSGTTDQETKVKSKTIWKTWERSRRVKSKKQAIFSIFGTSRKSDSTDFHDEIVDDIKREGKKQVTTNKKTCQDLFQLEVGGKMNKEIKNVSTSANLSTQTNSQDNSCDSKRPDWNNQDNSCDSKRPDWNSQDNSCDSKRPNWNSQNNSCDSKRPDWNSQDNSCDSKRPDWNSQDNSCDSKRPDWNSQDNSCDSKRPDWNSQDNSCDSKRPDWKQSHEASESWSKIPESSPPLSATTAFCILKLEELERSIEKTIREKFPDSEPLLLRKRSKEELRSSKSLPTTPSLKKKLYTSQDQNLPVISLRQNGDSGTRFCDETYESPPSAARSPVVLRRFGTRTRHASMSPKLQRAKTAALFNSPTELSGFDTVNKKMGFRGLSAQQITATTLPDTIFSAANKSDSKYDNVVDTADITIGLLSSDTSDSLFRHVSQGSGEREETITYDDMGTERDLKQMIVPTSSAVFGSVSPKLTRNVQAKFNIEKDKINLPGNISSVECYSNKRFNELSSESHQNEEYITESLDSSVCRLDSTGIGPGSTKQSQTGYQESRRLLACYPPNSTSKTEKRKQSGKQDTTRSVHECIPSEMSVSDANAELNDVDNTDLKVIMNQQSTGKYCYRIDNREPNSSEETLSCTEPHNICKKPGLVTSDTAQKNATDHVMLGSPVALPSRDSSVPETASHISQSAHAQISIPYVGNIFRHARKQNSGGNKKLQFAPFSAPSLSSSVHSTTPANISHREAADDVLHKYDDSLNTSGNQHEETLVVASGIRLYGSVAIQPSYSSSAGPDNGISDSRADSKISFTRGMNVLVSEHTLDVFDCTDINTTCQQQHPHLERRRDLQDQQQEYRDEENLSVLKQPVSEVISQMISHSKRLPQQHELHTQQQQRQLRHTTFISPKSSTMNVKQVDNLVLGESRHLQNSRCQEIQTDSFTTADKSVDSDGLVETSDSATVSNMNQILSGLTSRPDLQSMEAEKIAAIDDSGEIDVGMGLAGKKICRRKNINETKISEQVPPSSPTAMQELTEELDDVEDDVSNEEFSVPINKEREMKQFTELIFKRLSDLLGSQSIDENSIEEDVFRKDGAEKNSESEMEFLPKLADPDSPREVDPRVEDDSMTVHSGSASTLLKVLTIETSSSLTTTTTSSDSDIDETQLMFPNADDKKKNENCQDTEGYLKREGETGASVFRRREMDALLQLHDDVGQTCRDYHSDDDVATGRGIPDYYDDRPLWSRREQTPGQLSATVMAIRRRERKERWLKKRRRNKTDLMSTGSSDTASDKCFSGDYSLVQEDSHYFNQSDSTRTACRSDLGSGILASPKYTKPIIPFFDSGQTVTEVSVKTVSERLQPSGEHKHEYSSREHSHLKHRQDTRREEDSSQIKDEDEQYGRDKSQLGGAGASDGSDGANIEDTFHKLLSVQNILVEMQDWRPPIGDGSERKCLPLTTENVRTIREYYKDCYSSGNGRRSRMSATDRTESDLDLYSEMRDDASSDSQVYADDEGDDDGLEPYVTAEDDISAACGGQSTGARSSMVGGKDEEDTSVVLSCIFYNSNTHAEKVSEISEVETLHVSNTETKTSHESVSVIPASCSPVFNSDDEFWTGSTLMNESYKQLEAAADSVSSTFQNAREQMHDIQHHLQALRRQMEVMQDDLTSISTNLSPTTTLDYTQK